MLLERKPPTVRAAMWSATHPWRAIGCWLLFVALCLAVGSAVGTRNATSADYRVGEAGRAEAIAEAGELRNRPVERVMISGPAEESDTAARELTARMKALPEVHGVASPVRSADGSALLVSVTMKGAELDGKAKVAALTAQTDAVQRAHPALRVEQTGTASIGKGVDRQRGQDLALSEAITFPVTLVTLLVVFGSVIMAGVPLLLALSSIAAAVGLSMLASHLSPDAGVGTNVILLIGMAVGVDYTLFYLKREREERARAGGRLSPEALVELAAATSGRMIVVSGLAVIVSTATLYLATDVVFSSLATGTIVVVLASVISSLTALPALLVLIGRRTSARPKQARAGRLWDALLTPAARRPWITLAASVLVMVVLSLPLLGMEQRVLNKDSHSREIPALQSYDRLTAAFPELRIRHQVVARATSGRRAEMTAALRELVRRTRHDPLYTGDPALRLSADETVAVLDVASPYRLSSAEAGRSLDRLRTVHLPATLGAVEGVEAYVSGDVARDADYLAHQNAKLPLVGGALLLVTFAMTVAVFRSVVIGAVGVVLNVLSATAAMGVLTLVFHTVGSRVPLFLLVILFGLSMDYQVFVVSRIKEAVERGLGHRTAVIDGVARSASVVTSAAVVMVTVFASFVFLHLAEMRQIGLGLAVAVLLDAVVVRVLILPAALVLLGRRSWWPGSYSSRLAVSGENAGRQTATYSAPSGPTL
ncbi:MMPL family transporter [Nonomuraea sp. bgisy101]|uniref:MMPL family transporter n=1 Tax=Nonomuraea sp. bgisy101 TaxID=3413784 RepID=UPI003D758E17